ncbi:hypothetical protein SPRG_01101 [Saprolegnia parasitica CBS 223.65]|uniref:Histidine acid phosphatase n=1 Tax=Saprolegnia parasitica (strain CBS 223.65) TaxID=695850 RepID=A0A067D7Q0_SAPPC|nr:hypothetical protein SPRG_01101 [Saprolegnia parasitica CBS 223.65]KDO35037.1 hypothetical protein SPRG_01101 [Saprolegnia parasitica CBS 223.65]|eukprot:XP_012194690.1 hypothetical protein SPRG_01101 [Saprolegnia parasitica CBS 223.65]
MRREALVVWLVGAAAALDADEWADFPAYCAKHVEKNAIAPLPSADQYALNQVQIAIRHGARTLVQRSTCWSGYNATWNCNARNHIEPALGASTHRSFDVQYTPGETVLQGTCQVGQLLDEGYRQETTNGQHFYDAYIASSRLFPKDTPVDLADPTSVYLSSTDMQRTVMSGQLVVDAMFPMPATTAALIPWHVGDVSQSSFIPNPFACPRLGDLKDAFEASDGYRLWLHMHDELVATMHATFPNYDPKGLFDCMLTARCSLTRNDMPLALTPSLYKDIIRFERDKRMKIYTEDDEYAKLSMSKLLRSIRAKMQASSPKFVLYSGHDDTVMPILAAIGGADWLRDWPPYAAFVAFEVYTQVATAARFVRIVYQGKPLTLPGCNADALCPLSLFLEWTAFAETADCTRSTPPALETPEPVPATDAGVSITDESSTHVSVDTFLVVVVVAVLLGFVFGLLVAKVARQTEASDRKTEKLLLDAAAADDDETGGLLPAATSEPSSPTVAMAKKK